AILPPEEILERHEQRVGPGVEERLHESVAERRRKRYVGAESGEPRQADGGRALWLGRGLPPFGERLGIVGPGRRHRDRRGAGPDGERAGPAGATRAPSATP